MIMKFIGMVGMFLFPQTTEKNLAIYSVSNFTEHVIYQWTPPPILFHN